MKSIHKSLAIAAGALMMLASCGKNLPEGAYGKLTFGGKSYPVRLEITQSEETAFGLAFVSTDIVGDQYGQYVSGEGPVATIIVKALENGIYSIANQSLRSAGLMPSYTRDAVPDTYVSEDCIAKIETMDGKNFSVSASGTGILRKAVVVGPIEVTKANDEETISFSITYDGPAAVFNQVAQ